MKKYFIIFWKFFKVNQSAVLVYRGNFLSSLTADIVWALFNILSFFFITRRANNIGGWSGNEIMLLASTFNVISGVYFMLFSRSFFRLAEIVQKGLLDGILLKPLDSQFFISFQYSNITKILRTFLSLILNFYLLQQMHFTPSIINIMSFIILSLVGLIILYSLSVILFSVLIWNPELSNLYSLIWDYLQASRYPKEIFEGLNAFVFLIMLPVTFVVSTPVKALMQKALLGEIIWVFFIALATFIIARVIWRFSLRSYTSSSL